MPERLSDREWLALLGERDPFKLTIRGCSALEADMDAYCEELFRAPMPDGMSGLGPFSKRLAVAAAIGVVPASLVKPMQKLWKLRNDYAHGDLVDLPDSRMEAIRQSYLVGGFAADRFPSPLDLFGRPVSDNALLHLVVALQLTRAAMSVVFDALRAERDDPLRSSAVRAALLARLRETTRRSAE